MSDDDVIVEKERGRVRIVLNRPDRHNAIAGTMSVRIADALWAADADDEGKTAKSRQAAPARKSDRS